jgi:hypothetical protein
MGQRMTIEALEFLTDARGLVLEPIGPEASRPSATST